MSNDVVLVANLGQQHTGSRATVNADALGQGFETGENYFGYQLGSVELDVHQLPSDTSRIVVTLWSSKPQRNATFRIPGQQLAVPDPPERPTGRPQHARRPGRKTFLEPRSAHIVRFNSPNVSPELELCTNRKLPARLRPRNSTTRRQSTLRVDVKSNEITAIPELLNNSVHWVLDVSFREDESRVRTGNAPENLALIRHMAFNLLR